MSKPAYFAALAAALILASVARAAPATAPADLEGDWLAEAPFMMNVIQRVAPPFKPEAAARFRASMDQLAAGAVLDWCGPMKFSGYSYGLGGKLEIRVRPGRITLTATDASLKRRIDVGAPSRRPAGPSASGSSVGRWDGDALVVRTTGLDPGARYPLPMPDGPTLGEGAVVTERFRLEDKDTLVLDMETAAPAVLSTPDRRRFVYRRVNNAVADAGPYCSRHDRSLNRATGRQQLDLTPPKDLPPPPG